MLALSAHSTCKLTAINKAVGVMLSSLLFCYRCGHCKSLTPEYKKVGEAVSKDAKLNKRVVIAKVRITHICAFWLANSRGVPKPVQNQHEMSVVNLWSIKCNLLPCSTYSQITCSHRALYAGFPSPPVRRAIYVPTNVLTVRYAVYR